MARVFRRNDLERAINEARTDALKKGLAGELEVISILESGLPESCIVIWQPQFLQYKPDILVIDPSLGFLFLEVKNWSLPYVKRFLFNGKLETLYGLKFPLGQTDNYINELQSYVNSMKAKQQDIYRMTSSFVIYTGFSKDDFSNRREVRNWRSQNLQDYFKKHLFLEDIKVSPYSKLLALKRFNNNLHTLFTTEEINYLAKSLGHTDEAMEEDSIRTSNAAFPVSDETVQKVKAPKDQKDRSTKILEITLYILCCLLVSFALYTSADSFLMPSPPASDTGNSEELYEQAIKDAKFALANGDYQNALGLYELALAERPDDHEAKALYESLLLLNDLTVLAENAEWERVISTIDELNNKGEVPVHLERQFQQLHEETVKKQEKQEIIVNAIDEAVSLIAEKRFKEAQDLLNNLNTDQSMTTTAEKNEARITALFKEIEKGLEELAQQEKATGTEDKKEPVKVEAVSNRTKYMDKLNDIQNGLTELNYLYEDGITANILEAEVESLERWDDALNEIYGVLKTTLSTSEMTSLRNEQRNWIVYRDHEAEAAAKEFEGGSFEAVTLISVKQQLTRDRCYILVEEYME